MMYKESRPFPNESTYEFFNGAFCCRCTKYKLGDDGMPLSDNCATEMAISHAQFDETLWPKDSIVATEHNPHVCLHFESDNELLMLAYKMLFAEAAKEGDQHA